jgi:hypothetical protein
MRWAMKAITALSALACALACGAKGGGNSTVITITPAFPQGFLPRLLGGSSGSGDVAFKPAGDLFIVVAGSADVTAISRDTGAVSTFASDVGGGSNSLLSIVASGDDRLFVGDASGRIWAIAADGTASLVIDTGGQPITGLAFAPASIPELTGALFAAAGDGGILRIAVSDSPTVTTFVADTSTTRYIDVGFSATTLYALDEQGDKVDTVSTAGVTALLEGGFDAPVGMAVDTTANEVYVADAGAALIRSFPTAGGTLTDRASYHFDSDAPSGLAYDGIGALAFLTSTPFAVRGSALPRINPANPNYGLRFAGPTVGFGDLEFDRLGGFVLTANAIDPPTSNFIFGVTRDGSTAGLLASAIGLTDEQLTGVAVDPFTQNIYVATRLGNIYQRLPDGTVSLLVSVTSSEILGLELAPALPAGQGFDPYNGDLVATTSDGQVFAIDPVSPNPPTRITSSPIGMQLSDLVFSSQGVLYVVDNRTTTSRILRVTSAGVATNLQASTSLLGLADGIEIDEGGNRLLVTSDKSPDQLLAVGLGTIPAPVSGLANVDINDGFLPTGVVYDRLGTAVVRVGENSSAIDAIDVSP